MVQPCSFIQFVCASCWPVAVALQRSRCLGWTRHRAKAPAGRVEGRNRLQPSTVFTHFLLGELQIELR